MRASLLDLLVCNRCDAGFRLVEKEVEGPHVMEGVLTCKKCERSVPIIRGVPDFVAAARGNDARVEQTTSGFARNWWRYSDVILASPALNDDLFRDWVWPLSVDKLAGKTVLDAGCGMGRWMTVVAPHQPATLVGFDYSDVIWAAFKNTRHLKNTHAVRADIFDLPFRPAFDVTYSIGVVHHTPDPAGAFRALADVTQKDGALAIWVYGEEGNEWIHKYVTPLRELVTSRMPDVALHALSRALSLQLLAAARAYVAFAPTRGPLPSDAYLRHLLKYPPRYVEHIVYDHLVPQLAQYISRAEVDRWVAENGLHAIVSARNENSWRIVGARSAAALEQYTEDAP